MQTPKQYHKWGIYLISVEAKNQAFDGIKGSHSGCYVSLYQ